MKSSVILIKMERESYDYDLVLNYLKENYLVKELLVTTEGLYVRICYLDASERKNLLKLLIYLDVKDIMFHEILYEEFLSKSPNKSITTSIDDRLMRYDENT